VLPESSVTLNAAPIDNPIIFVRQTPVDYTFNTIADIFGNFYSFGNYTAEVQDCAVGEKFGMPAGGNLFMLEPDGALSNLTQLENGAVRDPEISYDGEWVIFSMKTSPCAAWQIYEMNIESRALLKVSRDLHYNDLDPAYGPDGRILFTTDRLDWADGYQNLPAAQLYTMQADGSDVQLLSNNPHGIFNPLPSSDGMIYFTQWDFHDTRTTILEPTLELDVNRFLMWKIHDDGSREGHPAFGAHTIADFEGGFTGIREIPTEPGVFVATLADEFHTFGAGSIVRFAPDPELHFDNDSYEFITPNVFRNQDHHSARYRDPYPLVNGQIIASYAPLRTYCRDDICSDGPPVFSLVLLSVDGSRQTALFDDDAMWNLQPVEVVPHESYGYTRGVAHWEFDYGILNSLDVYHRGINGDAVTNGDHQPPIAPGTAHTVRIFTMRRDRNGYEEFSDYDDPTDTLLGDVPVQPDGSFAAFVPANIPLIWQVLDAQGNLLVKERFFSEVARGELRQCSGCHSPHDGSFGSTTNSALSSPTNLTGREDLDYDDNGLPDLLDTLAP
jgi:hypothetical protein